MRLSPSSALAIWLALCFHGPMVAAGLYRYTYDAHIHLFFADHYQRAWFSLWEPRWFGGFPVNTYPPLVHQLLALLGGLVGLDAAFGLLLLATLVLVPVAVYRFACIFVSPTAARYAALAGVFLPGISLASDNFGQLPTLVGLVVSLFFLAELRRYLVYGERWTLALVASLAAMATASHHATSLLFLPPAALAVTATVMLCAARGSGRAFLVYIRTGAAAQLTRRSSAAAIGAAAVSAVVILPFWTGGVDLVAQTPIPHPTRLNYLTNVDAQNLFFWAIYGVLPALAGHGLLTCRLRPVVALVALAGFLGVLGLGATTPLPALIFGPGWQWLTYDRFALWASVALLPFAGIALASLLARSGLARQIAAGAALLLLVAYTGVAALLAPLSPSQPYQVDLQPIVDFLSAEDRVRWRYQTFGFGDGIHGIGYRVDAATIDGGYYTARRLPELTASGIGQIDYALWWDPSGQALRTILASANAYSIRWAFVREPGYPPYLVEAGFRPHSTLPNGVDVWENPAAPPLSASALDYGPTDLSGILWGTLPILSAVLSIVFVAGRLAWRARPVRGMALQPTGDRVPVTVQADEPDGVAPVLISPGGGRR